MLTEKETNAIRALNRRNEYCLTPESLKDLWVRHRKARMRGDKHEMESIEYRLTDINFHEECGLLMTGAYDEIDRIIENW